MRKFKRRTALFCAAFVIAGMVMSFCALFVIADSNTQKTGFNKRAKHLEISLMGDDAAVFVNGREYKVCLSPIYDVLESGLTHIGTFVWFFV